MTDADVEAFVLKFAAAWATRDGDQFLALWHPDGVLRTPFVGRPIDGSELGKLTEVQAQNSRTVWQLIDWASRGDVVVIEWQNSGFAEGKRFDFRGVDKFRLRDGKIAEEIVYADTAPLRAALKGERLEPMMMI